MSNIVNRLSHQTWYLKERFMIFTFNHTKESDLILLMSWYVEQFLPLNIMLFLSFHIWYFPHSSIPYQMHNGLARFRATATNKTKLIDVIRMHNRDDRADTQPTVNKVSDFPKNWQCKNKWGKVSNARLCVGVSIFLLMY